MMRCINRHFTTLDKTRITGVHEAARECGPTNASMIAIIRNTIDL